MQKIEKEKTTNITEGGQYSFVKLQERKKHIMNL